MISTHSIAPLSGVPNARAIVGRLILTIDVSSVVMNVPTMTRPRITQGLVPLAPRVIALLRAASPMPNTGADSEPIEVPRLGLAYGVVHVHDAVIVGAGPAGSAAAHFLSARGLDVLLLDRADFPRDKTCGDGLTPRALRVLDQMGILSEVTRYGCPVDAYSVVAPNRRETSAPITAHHGALVVKRVVLDDIIQRRALASGARFTSGVNASRVE